jgi:hypothetical protein
LAGPFAVADPATAIVNNSLARAEEEPENRKNRETVEPVSGEILEPVAVAQPATLPPWTLLDDVLRRIAKLCGSREIAPWNPVTRRGGNRQRWIKAFREHRQHLILALEDAELQKPYGFRTSAGAYLNKRFNDRVAGRAPRWQRPNQQEIRP